jgi:hypothetical protein
MSDIILALDAAEAVALDAALTEYQGALLRATAQGGVAAEMAETMRPFADRVARRLHEQMYVLTAEPEQVDPLTAAKAIRDALDPECDCHWINREADRLGNYPADISYHDYQAAR